MPSSGLFAALAAFSLAISGLAPQTPYPSRDSGEPVELLVLTSTEAEPTTIATAALDEISLGSGQRRMSIPAWRVTMRTQSLTEYPQPAEVLDPSEGASILTQPLEVSPFMVLGLTWAAESTIAADTQFWVRVREQGEWTEWFLTTAEETSPKDGHVQTSGTEPFVTGKADAVQIRVTGSNDGLPADLKVALIPTNPSEEEVELDESDVSVVTAEATAVDASAQHEIDYHSDQSSDRHPLLGKYSRSIESQKESTDGANSNLHNTLVEEAVSAEETGLTATGSGGKGQSVAVATSLGRMSSTSSGNVYGVPIATRVDW